MDPVTPPPRSEAFQASTMVPDEILQYAARQVDALRSCPGHHFVLERRPGLPTVYRCANCQGVVSPGMAELYAHGLRHGREDIKHGSEDDAEGAAKQAELTRLLRWFFDISADNPKYWGTKPEWRDARRILNCDDA